MMCIALFYAETLFGSAHRGIVFVLTKPYRIARNTNQSWSEDKNLFQGFLWDHGTVSRSTESTPIFVGAKEA